MQGEEDAKVSGRDSDRGKKESLGYHANEMDAVRAYDRALIVMKGDKAKTNLPIEQYDAERAKLAAYDFNEFQAKEIETKSHRNANWTPNFRGGATVHAQAKERSAERQVARGDHRERQKEEPRVPRHPGGGCEGVRQGCGVAAGFQAALAELPGGCPSGARAPRRARPMSVVTFEGRGGSGAGGVSVAKSGPRAASSRRRLPRWAAGGRHRGAA